MPRRVRDDRGAVTASVAVLAAVLALFFAVVQISLWFYGRSVATTAARHGLDAARIESGSAADGQVTALEFLAQAGGVTDYSVGATRSVTEVEMTITGEAITVLPFFDVPITVTIDGPVERFVE
ncbi:MAG TPA: TadE/TadG family type IV pilus assembly protein [Acidimicrobiales bacterium]|nr:TadE/TadG family type IV pilus assembly protein [Acidimicrobiales bacterium]